MVFGTFRDGSYVGPTNSVVPLRLSPATVAAGQTAWLLGSDLGTAAASDSVYLLPSDGSAEVDVTAWAVAAASTTAKFVLTLPATVGTAPADAPAPGVYQLRAGSGAQGTPGATRTSTVPVSIAAYVDPAGGPVLPGAPPFTVQGAGLHPRGHRGPGRPGHVDGYRGLPRSRRGQDRPVRNVILVLPADRAGRDARAGAGPGARHRVGSRLVGDTVNPATTASAPADEAP